MKHLTCLDQLSIDDVREILRIAKDLKADLLRGSRPALLQGRLVTQVFEKPSLRTRVSFEAAAVQLGGDSVFLSGKDAGFNGRETLCDIARVLSSYSDVVVLRTFSQELIEQFADASRCPVINGLSDDRHPCQALSDVFTIQEVFETLRGRRLAYIGDGNNVATSLAVLAAMLQVPLTICTPDGYQLDGSFLSELNHRFPAASVAVTTDPREAVREADIVYTDVWASMGKESEIEQRKKDFAPYQVNAELMAVASPECRFMHCLPARRGLEVTDEVLDGPQSIAFQQAENRMHLAKGLLVWLLGDGEPG